MANAILDMIRLQKSGVKEKIRLVLNKEAEAEHIRQQAESRKRGKALLERLKELSALKDGWDGYDAFPPPSINIGNDHFSYFALGKDRKTIKGMEPFSKENVTNVLTAIQNILHAGLHQHVRTF